MWLNVIQAKLNSKQCWSAVFPNCTRGGLMHLVGAPRDLYTQLLAHSSSQSVVALAFCLLPFCALFFPIPASLLRMGQVSSGSVSISLKCFSVMVSLGAARRVAMDTSSSCQGSAQLHQLCRHQCPSSCIGDEFNSYFIHKQSIFSDFSTDQYNNHQLVIHSLLNSKIFLQ